MDRESPRSIAAYLLGLRPVLQHAIAGRDTWVRSIGRMLEDARFGNVETVIQGASRVGRERLAHFHESRMQLESLRPPGSCLDCHIAVRDWLDQLVAVCNLLDEVGRTRDLRRLQFIDEVLSESRIHARRFNSEYARLAAELKRAAARPRRAGRSAAGLTRYSAA